MSFDTPEDVAQRTRLKLVRENRHSLSQQDVTPGASTTTVGRLLTLEINSSKAEPKSTSV